MNEMERKTDPTRILWTAEDLQTVMQCSRTTAYNLLNRADLPVVVIGRRRYMHASMFQSWLKDQVHISNP